LSEAPASTRKHPHGWQALLKDSTASGDDVMSLGSTPTHSATVTSPRGMFSTSRGDGAAGPDWTVLWPSYSASLMQFLTNDY